MEEEAGKPEVKGPVVGSVPFVDLGKDAILKIMSSVASSGKFSIEDYWGS